MFGEEKKKEHVNNVSTYPKMKVYCRFDFVTSSVVSYLLWF